MLNKPNAQCAEKETDRNTFKAFKKTKTKKTLPYMQTFTKGTLINHVATLITSTPTGLVCFQQPVLQSQQGRETLQKILHLKRLARELVSLGKAGPYISTAKESQLPVTKPKAKLSNGGIKRDSFTTGATFFEPMTQRCKRWPQEALLSTERKRKIGARPQ